MSLTTKVQSSTLVTCGKQDQTAPTPHVPVMSVQAALARTVYAKREAELMKAQARIKADITKNKV